MRKNVLVIGNGGREHALLWKLSQSKNIGRLFVTEKIAGVENISQSINIKTTDIRRLVAFAKKNKIDLSVVGPDNTLAAGVVDYFKKNRLRIFGPTKKAASIESSKSFGKSLMERASIPTASFKILKSHSKALKYVREIGTPLVIKANGLALGKGVYICHTLVEAKLALKKLMVDKIFGDSGEEVVIEEFLSGQEISVHAFSDGKTFSLFPTAQDHKKIGDGDIGNNTGGMGVISPVLFIKQKQLKNISESIVGPTLSTLEDIDAQFIGCLYPGLMMTKSGARVLEYNARFGDPETQTYMRLLKSDILSILDSCVDGTLARQKIKWREGFAVCIVLASKGYPETYIKDVPIFGIEKAGKMPGIVIFHAATKLIRGKLHTSGGRVLNVTAVGKTLKEALDRAYSAIRLIKFEGMQYRTDIGKNSLL